MNNDVLLSIADFGILKTELENFAEGDGTGLKNVNQRLKTLYDRELRYEKNTPSGLIVSMKIPVIES
jgi:LytS/YehU family sensor histidine kinase